ncbi:hypothetical protein BDQ17DRAFT_1343160 [Cyathus striatus]|nr:hypothetical protein BDQ17DRAFT_1343160 [Cyathus striatus]
MSTASLPSYVAPGFNRTPSYSVEPHAYEQRIALADRLRPRPSGNFVKESRNGDVRLRLSAQEDGVALPVYGSAGRVEGNIELTKVDGITSVEVKIEGRLHLREIGEGGTSSAKLCLDTALLWIKDPTNTICPPTLAFSLTLPTTFNFEDKTFPLPPTFDVKLSGVPGFTATIDYSVTATINKPNAVPALVPLVKSKTLGIHIGSTVVSTPFVYRPRTQWIHATPEWREYESVIRMKGGKGQDIITKLYIPASRIFCFTQPIPFHFTVLSTATSLAAYLPYGPIPSMISSKKVTRLEMMRQSTVDVRNPFTAGPKADIWRVDCIGEGSFKHAGDGPTWISFSGEIMIRNDVKVTGFRAAGLSVKDCLVIPIRLTTDSWTADGTGIGANHRGSEWSIPSTPDEYEDQEASAL